MKKFVNEKRHHTIHIKVAFDCILSACYTEWHSSKASMADKTPEYNKWTVTRMKEKKKHNSQRFTHIFFSLSSFGCCWYDWLYSIDGWHIRHSSNFNSQDIAGINIRRRQEIHKPRMTNGKCQENYSNIYTYVVEENKTRRTANG